MGLLKPLNPRFNRNHPLAPGCVAFWPFAETSGSAVDVVGGVAMAPQSSAKRASAPTGLGGECVGTQVGFSVTTPTSLRLGLPLTLACLCMFKGTPSSDSKVFGISFNNTAGSPFTSAEIGTGGGGSNIAINSNSSNAFYQVISSTGAASLVGLQSALVAVITSGRQELWLNGVSIASSTTARSNPTYGASSTMDAGFYPAVSRNNNIVVQCGGIWNRALSDSEVKLFSSDPFGIVEPVIRRRTYSIFGSSAKPWLYIPSTSVVYGYAAGAA